LLQQLLLLLVPELEAITMRRTAPETGLEPRGTYTTVKDASAIEKRIKTVKRTATGIVLQFDNMGLRRSEAERDSDAVNMRSDCWRSEQAFWSSTKNSNN
jgi:hypothetical protein